MSSMATSPEQGKPPTAPKSLTRDDYTVGWLCALPVEQTAAIGMLDFQHPDLSIPPNDTNTYTLGSIGSHNVVIAGLPAGEIGTVNIAVMAQQLAHTFSSIRFGLLVGIGGGVPSKVRLGDVVVSAPGHGHPGVVQWDYGIAERGQIRQTGVLNKPPRVLLNAISRLRANRDLATKKRKISDYLDQLEENLDPESAQKYRKRDSMKDAIFSEDYHHVQSPSDNGAKDGNREEGENEDEEGSCANCDMNYATERQPRNRREHYGLIVSGNSVIMDVALRKRLSKELNDEVLCIEMEAAGLMNDFPCVVIRGICDYADSHKNKVWQPYAAAVAAAYAKDLLGYVLSEEVKQEQLVKDVLSHVERGVEQIQAIQKSRQDDELLAWLTPINFGPQQSDYLEQRQQGTGQWLLGCGEYRNWVKGTNKTLFCPGNPGAGKTVLTSIVVDDLERKFGGDSTVGIAYVYCNYSSEETQKPKDLISSLLKQLLQHQPSLLPNLEGLRHRHKRKKTTPTLNEVFEVLKIVTDAFSKVFIIVDALDEYQSSNRREFLERIFCLRSTAKVHVFATSRPIEEIKEAFRNSLTVEVRASEDDVRAYLNSRISRSGLQALVSGKPDLQTNIISSIMKAADGMFLLTRFHFDSLEGQDTPNNIREVLQNLATGLNAYESIYDNAMTRIRGQLEPQRERAEQVLSWIVFARRPLTEDELKHALAVKGGTLELDDDDVPRVRDATSLCAGLVTINADKIVQTVHYTTREYFERTHSRWFPNAQLEITKACITYLSYLVFARGYRETREEFDQQAKDYPFYNYAATNWGYHAQVLPTCEEYLPFLAKKGQVEAAGQALILSKGNGYKGFSRRPSPRMNNIHLAACLGLEKAVVSLIDKDNVNKGDSSGRAPLSWAAANGHKSVAKILLNIEGVDPNQRDNYGRTPLSWTVHIGNGALLELLLDTHRVDPKLNDNDGHSPLYWAVIRENIPAMQLLLAKNVDPCEEDRFGSPLLHSAIRGGCAAVVDLLLASTSLGSNQGDTSGNTLLRLAIEEGHGGIVKLLLSAGVVPDQEDRFGRTPLHEAAKRRHIGIVKLLLDTKQVDPDREDRYGDTPLRFAILGGQVAIVELLLNTNLVDLDREDESGDKPLDLAGKRGEKAIEELLKKRLTAHL